jgi:hypothetical protein
MVVPSLTRKRSEVQILQRPPTKALVTEPFLTPAASQTVAMSAFMNLQTAFQ